MHFPLKHYCVSKTTTTIVTVEDSAMRKRLRFWQVCVCVGILLGIVLVGVRSWHDCVRVLIRNESGQKLHNISIKLGSAVRNVAELEAGEAKGVKFPVMSNEASFAVSAKCADGKCVETNDGYVDHSVRKCVISFQSSPDGGMVEIDISP